MKAELPAKTTELEAVMRGLEREPTHKIVLLYSGGADSTAAGLMLLEEGFSVYPIFFDYGQNARDAERYLAVTAVPSLEFQDTKIIRTDLLAQLSQSALLGGEAKNDTTAWVPARNTLFMIAAGIYAHQIDADGIAIGYMRSDQGVFGDSSFVHHKMMETLLAQTLSRPMDVHLPLAQMSKMDVLRYLHNQGFLELTVSCWNAQLENDVIRTCHECANCLEREENLRGILYEYKGQPPQQFSDLA